MNMFKEDDDCSKQEVCELPTAGPSINTTTLPPPCPPPEMPCSIIEAPLPEVESPPSKMPDIILCRPCLPCDWSAVAIQSTPPEIGCPPIVSGFGAVDGGIKVRYDGKAFDCGPKGFDATLAQDAWHSVLDLSTAKGFHSEITVLRNGVPSRINPTEFRNLGIKLLLTALTSGVDLDFSAVMGASQGKMTIVKTKPAGSNEFSYGLALVSSNKVVGTPLQLSVLVNQDDQPIGLMFDKSLMASAVELV